jgi:hypothetical protein
MDRCSIFLLYLCRVRNQSYQYSQPNLQHHLELQL